MGRRAIMDAATAKIRYQHWVQVIQDWSNSSFSNRDYCQQNGIDEKQFYYYQRRICALLTAQAECSVLPESSSGLAASFQGQQSNRSQIVKLHFPGMTQMSSSTISFSIATCQKNQSHLHQHLPQVL